MKRFLEWVRVFLHMGAAVALAVFNIVGMHVLKEACDGRVSYKSENEGRIQSGIEDKNDEMTQVTVMQILGRGLLKKQETAVEKVAYLTFDDGPSENTDKILDVLKEKGVKATFFVVGKTGELAEERYRRIVAEGHSLGLHSYSHKYEEIYSSLENFKADLLKLKDYLYQVTGEDVWLYRFPGGSSNRVTKVSIRECIDFLKREGIVYFDWNASSEDAVKVNASCSVLNSNILKDALHYDQPVILMHDLYECCNTADGLSSLIDRLLEEGYKIEPIGKDTKPVQHVRAGDVAIDNNFLHLAWISSMMGKCNKKVLLVGRSCA